MFKTYVKTSLRNLWNNRTFSLLNIAGLAIGIACAALIFLWVEDELSYNNYFSNKEQLFKIKDHQTYEGNTFTYDATPGPLGPAIKTEIPGIRNTARSSWSMQLPFTVGDKSINESGYYVDNSFLSMFQFEYLAGSSQNAFPNLNALVITEKMANRFFGNTNVVGKEIRMGKNEPFIISAVIKDLPENTNFVFEWLAPFKNFENQNQWLQYWGNNGVVTFVETQPNANIDNINRQLYNFLDSKDKNLIAKFSIYPMERWRMYDKFENGKEVEGRITFVRIFLIIAWIILAIACINFMNLSTARSEQRAREVGVRKVLGAGKNKLILQFIAESLVSAFISAILSIGIVYLALPFFNTLVEKQLSPGLNNPLHWLALFSITLICGLVAGSYPAFYLSSFNPVTVLKDLKVKTGRSAGFIRKGLVILQFSISIILIISTIIIYQQINYVKQRDLGYSKENLVTLPVQGNMKSNFGAIKNELLSTGWIENVGMSNNAVLNYGSNTGDFSWKGKDPQKQVLITMEGVNPDYIPTVGYQLKEGRNFYSDMSGDTANIIINETLAKLLKTDQVIGSSLTAGNEAYTVVGVVKDFVYNNMYESPSPMVFFSDTSQVRSLTIRIKKSANVNQAVAGIEKVIKKLNPGYPAEYRFVDAEFDKLFKTESLIGKLASVFAILAIFISCLGLFGLAAFTAERRKKEIGIRKVLGASTEKLVTLLSREFIILVGISCLIAFPLVLIAMQAFLENFAYRIQITWPVFAIAGFLAMLIAIFTVSFQAVKTASMNPVRSMRSE